MSSSLPDVLKGLHTSEIDARNGYEEALSDAGTHGLTSLFRQLAALHAGHAVELAAELEGAGEKADASGSFMTAVHRSIMSIRSLFGGLGESVLPGLIDGEKRNISKYDSALGIEDLPSAARTLLTRQRGQIESAIAEMQTMKAPA